MAGVMSNWPAFALTVTYTTRVGPAKDRVARMVSERGSSGPFDSRITLHPTVVYAPAGTSIAARNASLRVKDPGRSMNALVTYALPFPLVLRGIVATSSPPSSPRVALLGVT